MIFLAASALAYPNIDPTALELGPLVVRWYSLAYLVGLLFAWGFIRRQAAKPGAPLSVPHIDDFLTWATVGVIAGGRLGYVLFYNLPRYLEDPLAILRLWDGGMSFHGGLVGVILAIILFCRRYKLELFRVSDLIAIVTPVGLGLGRLANFINGELWGRPTDVSWAMIFPSDPLQVPRHPSQLYEAFGEGLLLFIILYGLWRFTKVAKNKPGVISGLFLLGYSMARLLVEFVREPDAHLGLTAGISRGQMLSVPMFLFAFWLIYKGMTTVKEVQKPSHRTKSKG